MNKKLNRDNKEIKKVVEKVTEIKIFTASANSLDFINNSDERRFMVVEKKKK